MEINDLRSLEKELLNDLLNYGKQKFRHTNSFVIFKSNTTHATFMPAKHSLVNIN